MCNPLILNEYLGLSSDYHSDNHEMIYNALFDYPGSCTEIRLGRTYDQAEITLWTNQGLSGKRQVVGRAARR